MVIGLAPVFLALAFSKKFQRDKNNQFIFNGDFHWLNKKKE